MIREQLYAYCNNDDCYSNNQTCGKNYKIFKPKFHWMTEKVIVLVETLIYNFSNKTKEIFSKICKYSKSTEYQGKSIIVVKIN